MKKYKTKFFSDLKDYYLRSVCEISKSGKENRTKIYFWRNGNKWTEEKIKNSKCHGLAKNYGRNSNLRNIIFANYKKNKTHGIEIYFNTKKFFRQLKK